MRIYLINMHHQQIILKQTAQYRNNSSNLSYNASFMQSLPKRIQFQHSYSQPKAKKNMIIVNKTKLPPDFFQKSNSIDKKLPNFKLSFKDKQRQFSQKIRKAESERLHYTPQKTSFFGFFQGDQVNQQNNDFLNLSKLIQPEKRKFQTRQQPKRQSIQQKRKFTPTSYSTKNQLLDLFPATHDNQLTQIIISTSNARNSKLSPRKQHISKYRQTQPLFNQEQGTLKNNSDIQQKLNIEYSPTKNIISLKNIEKSFPKKMKIDEKQTMNLHNMTFFNAKSSTLPPIKKPI